MATAITEHIDTLRDALDRVERARELLEPVDLARASEDVAAARLRLDWAGRKLREALHRAEIQGRYRRAVYGQTVEAPHA